MSDTNSQDYIFNLITYLNKSLTNSAFIELLRRATSASAARWLYFPRVFDGAPDYGQIFRFYIKGTSAAGLLTSPRRETPFIWQRRTHREPIGDIDMILAVNPRIAHSDYVTIRSLLIVRLTEALNEWMADPAKSSFKDQTYTGNTTSVHNWAAPLQGQVSDETTVLQKAIYDSMKPILSPKHSPIYYTLINNLMIKGQSTDVSLLKVLARPHWKKEELLDIVIPSHGYTHSYVDWAESDWLVNFTFMATTLDMPLTVPVLHPQYLAIDYIHGIESNTRPLKVERRTDALKGIMELLVENEIYNEVNPDEEAPEINSNSNNE